MGAAMGTAPPGTMRSRSVNCKRSLPAHISCGTRNAARSSAGVMRGTSCGRGVRRIGSSTVSPLFISAGVVVINRQACWAEDRPCRRLLATRRFSNYKAIRKSAVRLLKWDMIGRKRKAFVWQADPQSISLAILILRLPCEFHHRLGLAVNVELLVNAL